MTLVNRNQCLGIYLQSYFQVDLVQDQLAEIQMISHFILFHVLIIENFVIIICVRLIITMYIYFIVWFSVLIVDVLLSLSYKCVYCFHLTLYRLVTHYSMVKNVYLMGTALYMQCHGSISSRFFVSSIFQAFSSELNY